MSDSQSIQEQSATAQNQSELTVAEGGQPEMVYVGNDKFTERTTPLRIK